MSASVLRFPGRIAFACGLLSAVVGCSTTDRQEPPPPTQPPSLQIVYTPPSGTPGAAASIRRDGVPADWLGDIATVLQAEGFAITQFDTGRGFVAATRSLLPSEAIDCGWIVEARSDGRHDHHKGVESRLMISSVSDGDVVGTLREMELETRIVVTAQAVDDNTTRLATEANYVVIRTIADSAGNVLDRDVIHFRSGGRAELPEGAACQPTGSLERQVLANL